MYLDQLQAVQARHERAGGHRLGTLLWWSLSNNRIAHDALAELADRHGLPQEFVPSPVKPSGAFRRACRHTASGLIQGLLLRRIAESKDELVMGVVHEESDSSTRDLAYEVVSRVTFDKAGGSISVDREHSVAGQIRRLYQLHLDHSTEDVRGMLTSFLAEAGIALRESGGVYFVPHRFEGTLDALCKVVEDAGGNTCFRLARPRHRGR
jgi:hypothetical protein